MTYVEQYAVAIAAVAAGVAGLIYLARLLARSIRGTRRALATVGRLGDALLGDEETGKPGMPERLDAVDGRLAAIESELHPNGGGSLRDAVNRSEAKIDATAADLTALRAEFAAHLAEHARNPVTVNVNAPPAQG